jgi:hypothetical protein
MQRAVVEWREKFRLPVHGVAQALPPEQAQAHIELIREEFEDELVPALMTGDIVEIYDAGIDVLVYVIGMLSDCGMDIDPGLAEVMRGNYSKLDPETGEPIFSRGWEQDGAPIGKVLKGSAYEAPDLRSVLRSGAADIAHEWIRRGDFRHEEIYGLGSAERDDI